MSADVFDDLVAEQDRLEAILSGLSDDGWASPSGAAGWTVADVVFHLAQTEELVVASISGHASVDWHPAGVSLDDAVEQMVRAEQAPPAEIFQRWRSARRAAVSALRQADPQRPSLGSHAAQAEDAGHHSTGRALGARPGHHRPGSRRRSRSV